MNTFDLQVQTSASDGKHSPRDVVRMAAGRGLRTIAITDHDTPDGIAEALLEGGERGIRVIPGIEISVEDGGAHILGFGIDYKNAAMLEYSRKAKQNRVEGAKKMVENLGNSGFVVEWSDVEAKASGGVVARPHISKAVLGRPENKEKLGSVETVHDFIGKFLSNEGPNYVKRETIAAKDAIGLIRQAGGVAVWSHPAIHFRSPDGDIADYESLEKFLDELVGWGIEGLEVFTPSHTEDDAEFLLGLVESRGLLKTAGSDFHEEGQARKAVPTEQGVQSLRSAAFVGDWPTYGFSTDDILPKLDEALRRRKGV